MCLGQAGSQIAVVYLTQSRHRPTYPGYIMPNAVLDFNISSAPLAVIHK